MAWVRSEYAGALAVLSTWIAAALPWSATLLTVPVGGREATVVVIRFLYFRLQYIFGVSFGDQERPFLWVVEAPAFNPESLALASWLWVAGALAAALPVALSVVYYAREDWTEAALPVDPVRALGALLGVAGAALFASAVLFHAGQSATAPVGAAFALAFAYVLLTVERA